VIFPPLFGHQYSHCWVDFSLVQDAYMLNKGITYSENSRRATLAQQAYCIANPGGFVGYSDSLWGLTACDAPTGYAAHGAPPPQNDDGTIAPTAAAGSIVFAPEIVIPTLHNMYDTYGANLWSTYGFKDAFNLTANWWDTDYIGIDEGPIILMIENYLTGSVWSRFMQNVDVQRGLERAGFLPATDAFAGDIGTARFTLSQSFPNPVRLAATIPFRLGAAGHVSLVLYDVAGRKVRDLLEAPRQVGSYSLPFDSAGIPNGVYYIRMEVNGETRTRSCVIAR